MTGERIVRNVLMSTALVLGVAGCPPEPPDDNDAGPAGGTTAMGGRETGGTATAGGTTGGTAPVPVCATVASLPTMDTICNTLGESLCDPSGNQCVCEGRWNCNTICASTYPTQPTPNSACIRSVACNYPSGVNCECNASSRWMCAGTTDCPADLLTTGQACNNLTSVLCDYPNHTPHVTCACTPNADASTGSTWTCLTPPACPTTQPAYSLSNACPGWAYCSYGSIFCTCLQSGTPWVCGFGIGIFANIAPEPSS